MGIYQWSTTAAENDDAADDINWAEGQAPSTVNNSARQMMADVAEWIQDNQMWVSARYYGATGDGTTDDTAALQSALDTGKNVLIERGTYLVTAELLTKANYQRVHGAGRNETIIEVKSGFDLTDSGVFHVDHLLCEIADLTVRFDQSSATDRASLVAYPPAIYCDGASAGRRLRGFRLRFEAAYEGVVMNGNAGGALFDDIECGSLHRGFVADGTLAVVELRRWHVWPFGFAADTTLFDGIYQDGNTVAWRMGKMDALKMVSCISLRGKFETFEGVGSRGPFGEITGLSMDQQSAVIDIAAGELNVAGFYSTKNGASDYYLKVSGNAQVTLSSYDMGTGGASSEPLIEVTGGVLTMGNGIVGTGAHDNTILSVSGGECLVSNTRFFGTDIARSNPLIEQSSTGTLSLTGCRFTPTISAGSGTALSVGADGTHVIMGNQFGGYDVSLPAVADMVFAANEGIGNVAAVNEYAGAHRFDRVSADRIFTAALTIADDAVETYTPAVGSGALMVIASGNRVALLGYSTAAGATYSIAETGSGVIELADGALTGTTGNDTKITIGCHTDGDIYVENRTGSSVTARIVPLG